MSTKTDPSKINLHLSKNSLFTDNPKVTTGGFLENQKTEGNIMGAGAVKFKYPKGSTQFGISGLKPATENKYFKGFGSIDVKQTIPLFGGQFSLRAGINKPFGTNRWKPDLKNITAGIKFTKKF